MKWTGIFKFMLLMFALLLKTESMESAKILSIFTLPSRSHYIFGEAMLKELASRGHEITSVTVYPQKKPIKNFQDVIIETNNNILDGFMSDAANGEFMRKSILDLWIELSEIVQVMCTNILEHPKFQELMRSPENKFDVIIVDYFWAESLSGLGEHFNAPMIAVSTFGTIFGLDDVVGNSSPASIIPNGGLPFSSEMTLTERIISFIENLRQYYATVVYHLPTQAEIYAKHFPNASLSFDEARSNWDLYLLNHHHTLYYPRPFVPNVIEVGGLHIPEIQDPLPENLQKFLDNATEGAIYFSMGSNVKSKNLPIEKRNIILNTFRGLKQKVIWKFEEPELAGKPDNVLISSWLPQNSVLAHPNVKVFITHGGLLSLTESLHFGKIILGIPFYGDQQRNVGIAVKRGLGLSLNFNEMTEDDFKNALNELLYNPKYQENIKNSHNQFHDRPMTAMETAIFWIEYVLRHNGGKQLQTAGLRLNILQYYSVDVVGVLVGGTTLALLVIYWSIKKCIAILFQLKAKPKTQKQSSKKRKTKTG